LWIGVPYHQRKEKDNKLHAFEWLVVYVNCNKKAYRITILNVNILEKTSD
jgi:hypothetical protein